VQSFHLWLNKQPSRGLDTKPLRLLTNQKPVLHQGLRARLTLMPRTIHNLENNSGESVMRLQELPVQKKVFQQQLRLERFLLLTLMADHFRHLIHSQRSHGRASKHKA
jgi:hypothetical protein